MAIAGIGSRLRKRVDPTRYKRVRPVVAETTMDNSISGAKNPTERRIEPTRTGVALFDIKQKHLREFGGGRQ